MSKFLLYNSDEHNIPSIERKEDKKKYNNDENSEQNKCKYEFQRLDSLLKESSVIEKERKSTKKKKKKNEVKENDENYKGEIERNLTNYDSINSSTSLNNMNSKYIEDKMKVEKKKKKKKDKNIENNEKNKERKEKNNKSMDEKKKIKNPMNKCNKLKMDEINEENKYIKNISQNKEHYYNYDSITLECSKNKENNDNQKEIEESNKKMDNVEKLLSKKSRKERKIKKNKNDENEEIRKKINGNNKKIEKMGYNFLNENNKLLNNEIETHSVDDKENVEKEKEKYTSFNMQMENRKIKTSEDVNSKNSETKVSDNENVKNIRIKDTLHDKNRKNNNTKDNINEILITDSSIYINRNNKKCIEDNNDISYNMKQTTEIKSNRGEQNSSKYYEDYIFEEYVTSDELNQIVIKDGRKPKEKKKKKGKDEINKVDDENKKKNQEIETQKENKKKKKKKHKKISKEKKRKVKENTNENKNKEEKEIEKEKIEDENKVENREKAKEYEKEKGIDKDYKNEIDEHILKKKEIYLSENPECYNKENTENRSKNPNGELCMYEKESMQILKKNSSIAQEINTNTTLNISDLHNLCNTKDNVKHLETYESKVCIVNSFQNISSISSENYNSNRESYSCETFSYSVKKLFDLQSYLKNSIKSYRNLLKEHNLEKNERICIKEIITFHKLKLEWLKENKKKFLEEKNSRTSAVENNKIEQNDSSEEDKEEIIKNFERFNIIPFEESEENNNVIYRKEMDNTRIKNSKNNIIDKDNISKKIEEKERSLISDSSTKLINKKNTISNKNSSTFFDYSSSANNALLNYKKDVSILSGCEVDYEETDNKKLKEEIEKMEKIYIDKEEHSNKNIFESIYKFYVKNTIVEKTKSNDTYPNKTNDKNKIKGMNMELFLNFAKNYKIFKSLLTKSELEKTFLNECKGNAYIQDKDFKKVLMACAQIAFTKPPHKVNFTDTKRIYLSLISWLFNNSPEEQKEKIFNADTLSDITISKDYGRLIDNQSNNTKRLSDDKMKIHRSKLSSFSMHSKDKKRKNDITIKSLKFDITPNNSEKVKYSRNSTNFNLEHVKKYNKM